MRAASPFEDWPLEHASCAGSSADSEFIHAAGEVPELSAGSDVKDVEDDSRLLPWVAGILTAVCDQVLLIGAEVYQANLQSQGKCGVGAQHC